MIPKRFTLTSAPGTPGNPGTPGFPASPSGPYSSELHINEVSYQIKTDFLKED